MVFTHCTRRCLHSPASDWWWCGHASCTEMLILNKTYHFLSFLGKAIQ